MNQGITIECEKECYMPGEIISGKVSWNCTKTPSGIIIELKWNTAGRGTTDSYVIEKQKVPCSNSFGLVQFEIKIPDDCPPSYSGSLVSILWSLNARADISWAIDPKAAKEIIVSKTGKPMTPPPEYKGEN